MASRRPQQSSDAPVSLAGGSPRRNRTGDPILTIRVVPPYREAVQVNVTVSDRQAPPVLVPHGTEMARSAG